MHVSRNNIVCSPLGGWQKTSALYHVNYTSTSALYNTNSLASVLLTTDNFVIHLAFAMTVISNICEFNSLAHWRFQYNFNDSKFNLVLLIGIFRSSHDNDLSWMSRDLSNDRWLVSIGSGNGLVPHKGSVTGKMFPFDDAIVMAFICLKEADGALWYRWICYLGPLLLTWFNLNPSTDK